MSDPIDWLWYGEDEAGRKHISFGRFQSHACQHRYKYAEPQATEHDRHLHPTRSRTNAIAGEAPRRGLR